MRRKIQTVNENGTPNLTVDNPQVHAVEVAVVAPLDRTLSYAVPVALAGTVQIGSRVRVPLGRRQVVGYVVAWTVPGPKR